MVKGLLFKWEDSPALSHHCGFCERPLSHPGARFSCYGTHSEPCHRYHQAMFMRLRGHTCHYCRTIDEAHHGRHRRIAECLRDVYESAGEADWTIIPSEPEERGRPRAYNPNATDLGVADCGIAPEDTPSKRERKDAKCLARAASRARVISRDEILHVDSVIHSADGLSSSENDGPDNVEEIEEIERHLKYNAHVYNSQRDRRDLKKYARLPDVDVDFDAEMDRILDAFRIAELLKRNTRNRGLQGKGLKAFLTLVEEMKKMVVDDLVAVKKDVLEVGMRRAGYLRYTNKTAHSIVEDRYADKDWKTGEKLSPEGSSSSEPALPNDELESPHRVSSGSAMNTLHSIPKHEPDRRHLQKLHKRVNGDDGLAQVIIQPYHTPLLSMSAEMIAKKPAIQLRVVTNDHASVRSAQSNSARKTPANASDRPWQTVLHAKKPVKPSVKPAWGVTASGRAVAVSSPPVNPWGPEECEIPDLRSSTAPAVQPPPATSDPRADGPERFIDIEPAVGHTVVSQKKAKKYEREARRKAKKVSEQGRVAEILELPIDTKDAASCDSPPAAQPCDRICSSIMPPSDAVTEVMTPEAVTTRLKIKESDPCVELLGVTTPQPLAVTHRSKHVHWLKFKRQFIVDQLTDPCMSLWAGCSHGTSCAFETTGAVDCPFHEPHCSCVDPQYDECYLIYPCPQILSCGPYNRLRGEKLMVKYEQEAEFKGRIMLVDSDLIDYLRLDPHERDHARNAAMVPKRLAAEYVDFGEGYNPGPLMEQEKQFERLWSKNKMIKRQLSRDMLANVQHKKFENGEMDFYCYCHEIMPKRGLPKQVVECAHRDCTLRYFHKSCVKKLGVDKVSRWFCTMCEQRMQNLAYQTLRDLGYDDVPDEDKGISDSMDKIKEKYQIPAGAMDQLRSRIDSMGGDAKVAGVMAIAFGTGSVGK
ncbi:hypothetical protein EK21DRAFT_78467 [Setomelanomma holmii]|uniref:PHD-type domain-containing protein n=1 Tax=Setomelanomma holmii TaxID=210430 RepID=A0A9P4H0N2_9PLEO|nr:hypothetical protein EK21DRAFT_78467 [Setomelanomma holmii]